MTDSTKTKDVAEFRRIAPSALGSLACMMGHTRFRVVLKGKEPVALECASCGMTWTTERAKVSEPAEER